jgi:hypothetical protein
MAEAIVRAQRDARCMPSWDPSEPQDQQQEPHPAAPAATAEEIEAARRLLEELFEDEPPAQKP